jgi:hypothetical protein
MDRSQVHELSSRCRSWLSRLLSAVARAKAPKHNIGILNSTFREHINHHPRALTVTAQWPERSRILTFS